MNLKKLFLSVVALCLVATLMTTNIVTAEEDTGDLLVPPSTQETLTQKDDIEVTNTNDPVLDNIQNEPDVTPNVSPVPTDQTNKTSNNLARDGEAKATLYTNGWIIADENSLTFENGKVNVTWQIDDGGELDSVEIVFDGSTKTITADGSFNYDDIGISGELSDTDGSYTLTINNVTSDIDITIKGKAIDEAEEGDKVHVEAFANGWIDMDKDTALTFEEGIATLVFSPINEGKLISIEITNSDNGITIDEEGDFEFEGETHSLLKVGDVYTLTLNNVSKDTTIKVTGGSIYPDVSVDIDVRRELLILTEDDEYLTHYDIKSGQTFATSFFFATNVVPQSFTVEVAGETNTIGLGAGSFTVGQQKGEMKIEYDDENRPTYILDFGNLIGDTKITPNVKLAVTTKVNDDTRVFLQTSNRIVVNEYGSSTISFSLADRNKLDSLEVSAGGEMKTISERSFTVSNVNGSLSEADGVYTLQLNNIDVPVEVSISASDDVTFGGFEQSADKTLLPFTPLSGSVYNSAFGFTISYRTNADGSVYITHNASQATYHGGRARILSQSYASGTTIPKLTQPITISVTVQCTQGCGYIETSSITIPYREITVKFQDELGNPLSAPSGFTTSAYSMDNKTYEFVPPYIAWYEYVDGSATLSKTAGSTTMVEENGKVYFALDNNERGSITLTYKARGRVDVTYEDELGNPITFDNSTSNVTDYRGKTHTVPIPSHEWYDFESVDLVTEQGETPSGSVSNQSDEGIDVTIGVGDASTLEMKYKAKGEVTIKYVDELGNPIDDLMPEGTPFTIGGYRGDVYDIVTPTLDDYVYESMSISTPIGATVSGNLNPTSKKVTLGFEDASVITVVYHAKASVNVNYVDDEGTPIDDLMPADKTVIIEGLRGEEFSVATPGMADYTFERMYITTPDGSIESAFLDADAHKTELNFQYASTITLVYRAKASFKVEYIDDIGDSINDVIAAADPTVPFEYVGHRDDENLIPTPELTDYQFNSMRVEMGQSVSLNPDTHISTMNAGYDGVIYVVYDYRATVYLKYEDMNGKDIADQFDPANPTFLEGFRNRETEIPNPEVGSYIFDHFEIETIEGETPSGYLHGGDHDPTLTFGVREASTVTVVYRFIDLKIELKDILHDGETIGANKLHYGEYADFIWTVTNEGTAGALPEIVFTVPDEFSLTNITPDSNMDEDGKLKFEKVLEPGESIDVTIRVTVNTVSTNFEGKIKAEIPEQQEDSKTNTLYPDINLLNNKAEGLLTVYNPPVIITKVNSRNRRERLDGAKISIYDQYDNLVYSGWSDSEGEWYVTGLYPGEYKIKEWVAPDGFVLRRGAWTLTVHDDMTASGTTLTNTPIQVAVQKVDSVTGKPLEGAYFTLFDEDGDVVVTKITDEDGMVYFNRLDYGRYTIEEIAAPKGYALNGKAIKIRVDRDYRNGDPYIVQDAKIVDTGTMTTSSYIGLFSTVAFFTIVGIYIVLKSKKDEEA